MYEEEQGRRCAGNERGNCQGDEIPVGLQFPSGCCELECSECSKACVA